VRDVGAHVTANVVERLLAAILVGVVVERHRAANLFLDDGEQLVVIHLGLFVRDDG
jgi:hypothetical protein